MSALAPLLLKGLSGPARRLVVPRARVHSKPAREPFGTLDVAIGLTSSFLCCLLPAGWVLSHLACYKEPKE